MCVCVGGGGVRAYVRACVCVFVYEMIYIFKQRFCFGSLRLLCLGWRFKLKRWIRLALALTEKQNKKRGLKQLPNVVLMILTG